MNQTAFQEELVQNKFYILKDNTEIRSNQFRCTIELYILCHSYMFYYIAVHNDAIFKIMAKFLKFI